MKLDVIDQSGLSIRYDVNGDGFLLGILDALVRYRDEEIISVDL